MGFFRLDFFARKGSYAGQPSGYKSALHLSPNVVTGLSRRQLAAFEWVAICPRIEAATTAPMARPTNVATRFQVGRSYDRIIRMPA
jgi:hypothetical protein